MNKLAEIQQKLNVPKSHKNTFGNYNYRNLEDILEAVKPLLGKATLTTQDEIVTIGARFYVKATATLKDGKDEWTNTAYAREAEVKKGMDEAQITGATSSYARKYCLNGLFAIDDTKDTDFHEPKKKSKEELGRIAGLMKIATTAEARKLYHDLEPEEKKEAVIIEAVEEIKAR